MTDRITLSDRDLERVVREFQATPKQVLKATKRAIRKTQTFAGSRAARAVAREHGIPVKALRQRRRVAKSKITARSRSGVSGYIWIGTMPLRAIDVGKPRQTRTGVTVRKFRFQGAFLARMESGHLGVFKRAGAERLPIEEQHVPLPRAGRAIEIVRDREILPRLHELMRQELNYEVNVRARR